MNEAKTYEEWRAIGRTVVTGETALSYRVPADWDGTSPGQALFEPFQTTEAPGPRDTTGWGAIDPQEYLRRRAEAKLRNVDRRVKVKVEYNPETGVAAIWCGRGDKRLLSSLRSGGYAFHLASHRWRAKRSLDEVIDLANKLEEVGYNVQHLGFDWTPTPPVVT